MKYKTSFEQLYHAFGEWSPGGYDYNSRGNLYQPVLFLKRSSVKQLGTKADEIVEELNKTPLVGGYSHILIKENE